MDRVILRRPGVATMGACNPIRIAVSSNNHCRYVNFCLLGGQPGSYRLAGATITMTIGPGSGSTSGSSKRTWGHLFSVPVTSHLPSIICLIADIFPPP